jgi:hypothetical protein
MVGFTLALPTLRTVGEAERGNLAAGLLVQRAIADHASTATTRLSPPT